VSPGTQPRRQTPDGDTALNRDDDFESASTPDDADAT
jgi:hypothetical protein